MLLVVVSFESVYLSVGSVLRPTPGLGVVIWMNL